MKIKTTEYDRREIVRDFYASHPDADVRAEQWFDKWSILLEIIRDWDDDCMQAEYDELCDFLNGEEHLIKWHNSWGVKSDDSK